MPQCCILSCKNRSEGGYRLFKIPEGKGKEERIAIWKRFIDRQDLPKKAYVCEIHFDDHQFELRRQDGRKLLKWNAIPTVLSTQSIIESTMTENNRNSSNCTSNVAGVDVVMADHCYIAHENVEESVIDNDIGYLNRSLFHNLRQKLKAANKKIRFLETRIKSMEITFKEIFNEDQVNYLKKQTHRGEIWSEDTINKGLKLYLSCGVKGYEEIRKQKLPYPSIRTLQQRFRHFVLDEEEKLKAIKIEIVND